MLKGGSKRLHEGITFELSLHLIDAGPEGTLEESILDRVGKAET